ncbi:MAG: hypothetical protein JXA99_13650 [Candidatus Lokiarchaeota archaeon]|nr:hypothetical protein [Candidatus Lokiarchaeota archaeon]
MRFECEYKNHLKHEKWEGKIGKVEIHQNNYEFRIESRSGIMIIYGKTTRGYYVCVPDFNAGCHLVDWRDRYWNREKLTEVLGYVDGITIETAIHNFFKNVKK